MTSNTIDEEELAAMRGHSAEVERLKDLGWSDDRVEELKDAVGGYADFARCVQDEHRWRREHGRVDTVSA